jgi:CheY-like chemotaxis protein
MSHILVVDDDDQFRGYVVTTLRKRGYTVTEASNGKLALKLLHDDAMVDIIITDIVMPDMEGMEAIRRFQSDAPTAKILAISGGGTKGFDYLPFASKLGAHATLGKPFTPSEIVDVVNRLAAA